MFQQSNSNHLEKIAPLVKSLTWRAFGLAAVHGSRLKQFTSILIADPTNPVNDAGMNSSASVRLQ
ncbi:MAG: hypothetical protein HQL95_12330 [Magnetococcales bacterium]|nr:hypothetical protein [Magnetococcales bacterium]